MTPRASVAGLRDAGTTFETDEAVAIVQQLISTLRSRRGVDEGQPSYGPPSAETVVLNDDGSVSCRGCKTTPTLSEVGIFLHTLLPSGSPRVPGSLRYTIACALLTVDMPPFDSLNDSLNDFSRDLGRHERGDRADAVRRVLARSASDRAVSPVALPPRRRVAATFITIPPRGAALAAAAVLVAGFALIATRDIVRSGPAQLVATQTVPAVADVPIAGGRRVLPSRVASSTRGTASNRSQPRVHLGPGLIAVHEIYSRPEPRVVSVKRTKGVIDRLRLGWLRDAFTHHSDL